MKEEIVLTVIGKMDAGLRARMKDHYSAPKGFVGRSLCYRVSVGGVTYGYTVWGSTAKWLPGRNPKFCDLNCIVNNLFYSVSKVNGAYPMRNFTSEVVIACLYRVSIDWFCKYGDMVDRFETLTEPPRTGELYRRAGFQHAGRTKGQTCKRTGGTGSDSWKGARVWDTKNLRPKDVWYLNTTI